MTRVLPELLWPENCIIAASRMAILALFAACICKVTGIRSLRVMPRWWMAEIPARQLWHPVSAIVEKLTGVVGLVIVRPNAV